ncbi:MAG: hypothetical protein HUU43_01325 [Ignavibacteriaceae bacterium]|nr:hypothetical protein [Ignavibacteriaceae bacterium]
MKLLKYLTISLLLMSSAVMPQKIKDLIKPLNVQTGKETKFIISDVFYIKGGYSSLAIKENPRVKAQFSLKDSVLSVTPSQDARAYELLNFNLNGEEYVIPLQVKKPDYYRFEFHAEKEYKDVFIIGSFNGWNRSGDRMTDPEGDGIFTADIALDPGRYEYKFYADGQEIVDKRNDYQVPNGMGDFNSVIVITKEGVPELFLQIMEMKDLGDEIAVEYYYKANFPADIDTLAKIVALLDNKQLGMERLQWGEYFGFKVLLKKSELKGEKHLRVSALFNDFRMVSNTQQTLFIDGQPAGAPGVKQTWYDGIIYSLMIDRFNDGDKSLNNPIKHDSLFLPANYNGGDFQGIIDKLNEGYFSDLGINTIWVSPVYDNPNEAFREFPPPYHYYSGYHGYWPIDFTKTEEKFGSMEKLKELVQTAHSKGIKVLLDFVSHHTHEQHPKFKEHREWFGVLDLPDGRKNLRLWDEYRLSTWFEPYLPSFDFTKAPAAIEYVSENALWWLEQTGADGFRHDAVKHVPNEFWRTLTAKLKDKYQDEGKEVYQIGETFGGYDLISSYVTNGQLESQFNFNLFDVAIQVFIDSTQSFEILASEFDRTYHYYGPMHLMGNIMDSHDKIRYMAYADGDLVINQGDANMIAWNNPPKVDNLSSYAKAQLYLAYMFTIPGLPVIYYGSEFGMTGAADPDNRRMMRFGKDLNDTEKGMMENVKKLVKLRNEASALRYGDLMPVHIEKDILGYIRSDLNGRYLVVLNKGSRPAEKKIYVPSVYGYTLTDVFTDKRVSVYDPVKLDAYGYRIFKITAN